MAKEWRCGAIIIIHNEMGRVMNTGVLRIE